MSSQYRIETRYVHVGQMTLAEKPMALQAVVGPAVVVCMWDTTRALGAMVHCAFPAPAPGERPTSRCVSIAIPMLVQRFLDSGAQRSHLVAKVFGGASRRRGRLSARDPLGRQNAVAILQALADQGVPVIAEDLGGRMGRRLVYITRENRIRVLRTHNIRESDWLLER